MASCFELSGFLFLVDQSSYRMSNHWTNDDFIYDGTSIYTRPNVEKSDVNRSILTSCQFRGKDKILRNGRVKLEENGES